MKMGTDWPVMAICHASRILLIRAICEDDVGAATREIDGGVTALPAAPPPVMIAILFVMLAAPLLR
jgi:hypothetical protein